MNAKPRRSAIDAELLRAVIGVSAQLDLPTVLRRFVQASTELTGASYGAMSVLNSAGRPSTFVQHGVNPTVADQIAAPPQGLGVLGRVPDRGTLRLENLTEHPAFRGFPTNHPPMTSFLGAPVRVRSQVFGHLYLANKPGGFDEIDDELVTALASAAAVAIENAELYQSAQKRERWMAAAQEITATLLTGIDEEDALVMIAQRARDVADADTAALVLPSVGDSWILEIAEGSGADDLVGTIMPPGGRSMTVVNEGNGMVVESLYRTRTLRVEALRRYGPALYAPLRTSGRSVGVLILLREVGGPLFAPEDLATAEHFAGQAALALALAEARHAEDMTALLDERERIARDLHDLAIQQLFATGMQLDTVRRRTARGVDPSELTHIVESALDNVDETVRQIRSIVHALRDPDANVGLVERLRREASLARTGLGFAPSLIVTCSGAVVPDVAHGGELNGQESEQADRIDELVSADLADDVVAVVREALANAARHARASSVQINVDVSGERSVSVEVIDDGDGLPQSNSRRSGIVNLAARARRYAGAFTLENGADSGTVLRWTAHGQ